MVNRRVLRELARELEELAAKVRHLEASLESPPRAREGAVPPAVAAVLRAVEENLVGPEARQEGYTAVLTLVKRAEGRVRSSTVSTASEADLERMLVPHQELVQLGVAFANEGRLRLLRALAEGPRPSAHLSEVAGLVGGQLYHHLHELIRAGLVEHKARNLYQICPRRGLVAYLGFNLVARTLSNVHREPALSEGDEEPHEGPRADAETQ